jgi:hypothetical protein
VQPFFWKEPDIKKRTLIGIVISVMMACSCFSNQAIAVEIDHGQVIIAEEIKALSASVDNLTRQS